MHTFQPYPIDMLDINPFTKLSKEWALVTAGDKEKSNTMTVSWGGTGVLWGKNVVFIFIRESRYTKDFIDNGEFFSLSFLSEKYRDALKYCGAHSGRGEDKWSKAGLTPATRHGIPYPVPRHGYFYVTKARTQRLTAVPIAAVIRVLIFIVILAVAQLVIQFRLQAVLHEFGYGLFK